MLKIANVEINIQLVDGRRLVGRSIASAGKPVEHIRVVYCTGPLFFANVQKLRAQLANLAKGKVIILSMRGVPMIDTSGLQCLEELHRLLQQENRQLMLCGLQPQVANMLQKSSLTQSIGEKMIFWSAAEAIAAAQDMGAA